MELFALFKETSDQYGTSELIGIYQSAEAAWKNKPRSTRSFVRKFILDAPESQNRIYIDEPPAE